MSLPCADPDSGYTTRLTFSTAGPQSLVSPESAATESFVVFEKRVDTKDAKEAAGSATGNAADANCDGYNERCDEDCDEDCDSGDRADVEEIAPIPLAIPKLDGRVAGGVAPADLASAKEAAPQQRYRGLKNLPWFQLRQQVHGAIGEVLEHLQSRVEADPAYCAFTVEALSKPKQQKCSVLEANPAAFRYVRDFGFPDATPSTRSQSHVPPIMRTAGGGGGLSFWVLAALEACALIPTVLAFALPASGDGRETARALGTCVLWAELLVFVVLAEARRAEFREAARRIETLVFDASCKMAASLPRQMPSECGHSKYLRRQRAAPALYRALTLALALCAAVALLFPTSAMLRRLFPPLLGVGGTGNGGAEWAMLVGCAVCAALFWPARRAEAACRAATLNVRQSLCCNLRGFYPSSVFALDYGRVHGIDEGLCYFFGRSPQLFVPFLAVESVSLVLEPVDVRLRYRFTRKELARLDGRHNAKVVDVARRGYDVLEEKDILVWVVLGLTNDLRLWLPLSLTQWNPALFGFLGTEVATLLELAASALDNERAALPGGGDDDDEGGCARPETQILQQSLRNVADFCAAYQRLRRETVMEELLHHPRITTFVIPAEL
ncbi:hypothetical protein GMRT_12056 [Giardia muris]|uniref:Uncharacterized protein n=1 Tax=Giardia muris TaxID=5742 RepID=A0A4Z1SPF6_GIAMU|nr:hypothetical protein GMRT_12056 [Giardia muris]|eukprot:TNJ27702.1 hypothetical protein GMRT_12056 [Giardia muris]